MAIKNETNLETLKINYLSDTLFNEAIKNGQINENELYLTPYEAEPFTVSWNDINDIPSVFPPSTHYHDERYYTETEIDNIANSKASKSDFNNHTGDTVKHINSTERTKWNNASSHSTSLHAPTNAEVNQNAFSYVSVGNTTISADTKMDTLNLVAGSNIALTPDSTYDRITISATTGNYTLGSFGITATANELNYCDGVTSNIQTQLNNKSSIYHTHNGEYAPVSHTHTASDISGLGDIKAITYAQIDNLPYL